MIGMAIGFAIIIVLLMRDEKSARRELELLERAFPVGVSTWRDSEGVARMITFRDKNGTKYEALDYRNDGLLPDDADGLVDKVVSYLDSMSQTRRFSEELYSIMTERFLEALEQKYPDHELLFYYDNKWHVTPQEKKSLQSDPEKSY